MRWEDEPYVKLFSRDTPTWVAMSWQAKALLPLLMRKVDKAGLMECGQLGRSAVSLMTGLPEEVTVVGLESLERLGVTAWHGNTLEIPNFEEAQEARASDIARKRESRARAKKKLRAEPQPTEISTPRVTRGHTESQPVTPRHPSPDTTDTPAAEAAATPPKSHVPVRFEKPATEPESWTGDDFYSWAQFKRQEAGLVPERERPRDLGPWYSATLMTLQGAVQALCQGFYEFGDDPHWQKAKPALPFRAFMKQWDKYIPVEVLRASA